MHNIARQFEIETEAEGTSITLLAYVVLLYRRMRFLPKGDEGGFSVTFMPDQKKDFQSLLPRILNVMASPEHFPTDCAAITAHQQDNTYVPYKPPADEPAEPRRRPKLPTMRGSTSAKASFAP